MRHYLNPAEAVFAIIFFLGILTVFGAAAVEYRTLAKAGGGIIAAALVLWIVYAIIADRRDKRRRRDSNPQGQPLQ